MDIDMDTAPKITQEQINSLIVKTEFYVFPDSTLTVCCLTLKNGFKVTGESSCVSLENFSKTIGEKIAFEQAREKIWLLEGYLLKNNIARTNNG